MKGLTVNIADFRCRGVARATSAIQHRATRGLHCSGNPLGGADLAEDSAVYDIGMVREAQRLRRRNTIETINVERNAKVLRFRDVNPIQKELRVELARGVERRSAMPNGSYEPPPAA